MAIGKVLFLTRGGMDKDLKDIFMSMAPKGWKPVWADINDGEAKVAKELEDVEYLIAGGPITQKLIENAKKLKLLETGAQDTGHLPVKYAMGKGIILANGGGANANAVSEYVVSAMLNCLKHTLQFNRGLREGKWRINIDRKDTHELYDKTVGIVGFGNIGRRVAKICYDGYGANIIYYERFFVPYALRADMKAKPMNLEELLRQSDIVSIHVPSFTANRAMIGWEQLSMMKPTAYLINTSRGANIDEKALIRALNEGKIAGAALDVFDPEPPSPDNPLLNMPNVVATPHIAGNSAEVASRSYDILWRNIVLVSEGKEPVSRVREILKG